MGKRANRNRDYHPEEQYQDKYDKQSIKRKTFHQKDLCNFSAKSRNQGRFISEYYHGDNKIFSLLGYPGTGKTFLASRCAFDDVLDKSTPYDGVVFFRSAVDTRDTGYKPGTEAEKEAVYAAPYHAVVNDVFNLTYSEIYENLEDLGLVEFHSSSNQRGITYKNKIFIIDEVQNMKYDELRTVFTRAGDNCKIIMCGDSGQDDLTKKANDKSGLAQWMQVMGSMKGVSIHQFYDIEDIVRSGHVRELIKAEIRLGLI